MPWRHSKERVLVPYDFSASSRSALGVARAFVDSPDRLLVVNVVQNLLLPPYVDLGVYHALDLDGVKERARAALRDAVASEGVPTAELAVESGAPATAIVAVALDRKADLIVISTHGRTGLAHFAIDSVAERVVRTAPCPVLVLRSEPEPT
jgi:nucleotide-binding universal stress UspA family protein